MRMRTALRFFYPFNLVQSTFFSPRSGWVSSCWSRLPLATVLFCAATDALTEPVYADLMPNVQKSTPMDAIQLLDNDIWQLVHAQRDYVLVSIKTGQEGTFSTDGKTVKMDWYFKSSDRPVIMNGRALCIRSDIGVMKCMTVWSGPASDDCEYTLIEIKDDRQVCLREIKNW